MKTTTDALLYALDVAYGAMERTQEPDEPVDEDYRDYGGES